MPQPSRRVQSTCLQEASRWHDILRGGVPSRTSLSTAVPITFDIGWSTQNLADVLSLCPRLLVRLSFVICPTTVCLQAASVTFRRVVCPYPQRFRFTDLSRRSPLYPENVCSSRSDGRIDWDHETIDLRPVPRPPVTSADARFGISIVRPARDAPNTEPLSATATVRWCHGRSALSDVCCPGIHHRLQSPLAGLILPPMK